MSHSLLATSCLIFSRSFLKESSTQVCLFHCCQASTPTTVPTCFFRATQNLLLPNLMPPLNFHLTWSFSSILPVRHSPFLYHNLLIFFLPANHSFSCFSRRIPSISSLMWISRAKHGVTYLTAPHECLPGISKLTSKAERLVFCHPYSTNLLLLLTPETWESSFAPHSLSNRTAFTTSSTLSSNSSQIGPFLSIVTVPTPV